MCFEYSRDAGEITFARMRAFLSTVGNIESPLTINAKNPVEAGFVQIDETGRLCGCEG